MPFFGIESIDWTPVNKKYFVISGKFLLELGGNNALIGNYYV
jgi:hypothetical protein